jgi:hypothetical protein
LGFCTKLIVSKKITNLKRTKLIKGKKNQVRSRKNFKTKIRIISLITKETSLKLGEKEKYRTTKINLKS